jgi:hypothetical protein
VSFAFNDPARARRDSSKRRGELGGFGWSDAGKAGQILGAGGGQARQVAVETRQQIAGQIDRALAAHADAQEYRQQFCVGQRRRALLGKPLARAFRRGPIAYGHGLQSPLECRMAGF